MILQPIRFTITDNVNDVTTVLSRAVHGADAPDGFDEAHVKYERSSKYYGVFKSFSIPLKFVKGQAYLVREMFYTYGFASDMSVLVEKLNKVSGAYYTVYSGKMDFSTFKDSQDYCECNFIDGGLLNIIKKNEDLEVELSDTQFLENDEDEVVTQQFVLQLNILQSPAPADVYVSALHPVQMGRMILDKITGQDPLNRDYDIKSDTLETAISFDSPEILITSGKALRKFLSAPDSISTKTNAIKTTFSDWFKTLDAIYCLGMQIETINGKETIVIESRDYFFSETPDLYRIDPLGEVSKLIIAPHNEYNYSKIVGGWPEKDYDDETYKNREPNTKVTWVTDNITNKNEYNFEGKYRHDSMGVLTIYYANYYDGNWNFTLESTDDSDDEEIFVISCANNSLYNDKAIIFNFSQYTLTKVLGSYTGSCFRNTPRNNLLNHLNWLKNAMFGYDDTNIRFSSGGNDEFNNIVSGVNENASLPLSSVDRYFYPIMFQFEAPYPNDFIDTIESDPQYESRANYYNGLFIFYYEGNMYFGFLYSFEPKINDRSSGVFKVLSGDIGMYMQNFIR